MSQTFKIKQYKDMPKRIFKYELPLLETKDYYFAPFQILNLGVQDNTPVFWSLVFTEEEPNHYQITGLWTGMEYEEKDGTYIGTLTIDELVYHYFIREVYDGTR